MLATSNPDLVEIVETGNGTARLEQHFHVGQVAAFHSTKRFVLVLAGTQGGKTSFGPHWLFREMQLCGPGDYGVVTPTFTLLELKALPEFKRLFVDTYGLGEYTGSPVRVFRVSDHGAMRLFGHIPETPTHVFFGHAQDPDSLESATYKAVWLDEAGQKKFRRGSWEAIQRRIGLHQGRALFTTTPYDLGWLKSELYDPWLASGRDHPEIDVVNFPSIANPRFSRDEFQRMRRILPPWKFKMFYLGQFERPAGLIYGCFDETTHVVEPFPIPESWRRYAGADFGGVNTAAVFLAEERDDHNNPTGAFIAYREYLAGDRTAKEHVAVWKHGEPRSPVVIGGAKSEGQWRKEFTAAGLTISEPLVSEVEVGIDRIYGAIKLDRLRVFSSLTGLREQLRTYSRVLDERGEPTEAIEDKETYHYLDALRYVGSSVFRPSSRGGLL